MKKLVLYIVLGLGLTLPSIGLALPNSADLRCLLMRRGYHGNLTQYRQVQLYVTTTVGPFKLLNTAIDHEGNEHVANLWHLAYQRRLITEQLENLVEREVGPGFSVMAKTVDRVIVIPPEQVQVTLELLKQAKIDAAQDLADYLLLIPTDSSGASPAALSFLNAVSAHTKNNDTRPSIYVLGEGQTLLEPISPAALEKSRQYFRNRFRTRNELVDWIMENFGVGVGFHQVDSHANARMAAQDPKLAKDVMLFDPHRFLTHLRTALEQQRELAPLFAEKSSADVRSLFGEIRKYLEHMDIGAISPRLRAELLNLHKARGGQELAIEDMTFLLLEVEAYVRAVNVLDFLPIDTIIIDPSSRYAFENFGPWRGALYGDILRLGATNLTILHESLEKIVTLVEQIAQQSEQLDAAMNAPVESSKIQRIEQKITSLRNELIDLRQSILNETGLMVNRVHEELIRILNELGISRDDLRMVIYGDDFFIVWNKNIDPATVIEKIKNNPAIGDRLRLGGMKNESGRNFLTLGEARNTVGLTGEAMKKIESMGLGSPPTILTTAPFAGTVYFFEDGQLKKPSIPLLQNIKEQLPNWRFQ